MKARRGRPAWRVRLRKWVYTLPVDYLHRVVESRLFKQAVISMLLLGLVLGFQRIPFGFARRAEAGIRYVMDTEYSFAELSKQLASIRVNRERLGIPVLKSLFVPEQEPKEVVTPSARPEMAMPVQGRVSSAFGWRNDPVSGKPEFHEGIDIDAPRGTNVVAALEGTVVSVKESGRYGQVLEIDHGNGLVTLYAHNAQILVKPGQKVSKGTIVAKVGSTGNATSPHLHFEVKLNGKPVDPGPWLGLD